jgi:hypothetical protein
VTIPVSLGMVTAHRGHDLVQRARGNGRAGAAIQFARVTAGLALTHLDFIVV